MNFPINDRLVKRMKELMNTLGVWKRCDMIDHLQSFVRDTFPAVSTMNKSFYPLPEIVSSCMNRLKVSCRWSSMDQENVMAKVRGLVDFEYCNLLSITVSNT